MDFKLKKDADYIIDTSIKAVLPDEAVRRALIDFKMPKGKLYLVSVGKAGWKMAETAIDILGSESIYKGIVITKYDHCVYPLEGVELCEAGHPIPDENGFKATRAVLQEVKQLGADDLVLFLLSGGGSALFEDPLISPDDLQDITKQLLAKGADIVEINTIRKRLSGVKGGKFAESCAPARIYSIVLSDIIGDPLDMIASGPACVDTSTCQDALDIINRYEINMSDEALRLMKIETPKEITNVVTKITGSVTDLTEACKRACIELGYEPFILTDQLDCEAAEAGRFLSGILRTHAKEKRNLAFIAGGETVVRLKGNGLGGRNQEMALAACPGIADLKGAAIFSVGSDGTDGPTDAAGGYVDYESKKEMDEAGLDIHAYLENNDSYHILKKIGGLIVTGPTGTNVNDVAVALLKNS